MKEIKDLLNTIRTHVQIPDYYAGTRMCNSVRLNIYEQGPRLSPPEVASIRENYQNVLEFLLPESFFQVFKQFKVRLYYNKPYFNPFYTPIFHLVKSETEGYMFFDSADEYYSYLYDYSYLYGVFDLR